MTDEQLAGYTAIAAQAVCAVKDNDQVEMTAVWQKLDVDGLRAVVVRLAALIPDDVRMGPVLEAV